MDHIDKNNLLNKEQFGFQNKKSSTVAVLFFTEAVIENHENGIILLKTDNYSKENQRTLKADKTELLYFSTRDELEPKITFNGNFKNSAEGCRYLGTHLDSKLTFGASLNVVIEVAIRSLYMIKNHMPLEVKLQVFKF